VRSRSTMTDLTTFHQEGASDDMPFVVTEGFGASVVCGYLDCARLPIASFLYFRDNIREPIREDCNCCFDGIAELP